MECAALGRVKTRCVRGPPTRRCARCGAIAYCSLFHQISHWNDHKEECARFARQMTHANILNDFPFTFTKQSVFQINSEEPEICSFLLSQGLHQRGLWKFECCCGSFTEHSDISWEKNQWNLPGILCPCTAPKLPIATCLKSWDEYYQWRGLPFHSPVALLLHWPLTLYHCIQLVHSRISAGEDNKLHIHYLGKEGVMILKDRIMKEREKIKLLKLSGCILMITQHQMYPPMPLMVENHGSGPDRELLEIAVFGELIALFSGVQLHIEFIGPAVPDLRDGERIVLSSYPCCLEDCCTCKVSIKHSLSGSSSASCAVNVFLRKGLYHERYDDLLKKLIHQIGVPAIFSDHCEEAANLAAHCLETVTGRPLGLPVQVNPFRQPMRMENSVLYIPCYSNCFIFGI